MIPEDLRKADVAVHSAGCSDAEDTTLGVNTLSGPFLWYVGCTYVSKTRNVSRCQVPIYISGTDVTRRLVFLRFPVARIFEGYVKMLIGHLIRTSTGISTTPHRDHACTPLEVMLWEGVAPRPQKASPRTVHAQLGNLLQGQSLQNRAVYPTSGQPLGSWTIRLP